MARKVRCPVANTLDVVGDRWTLQVVRDLLRGHSRFGDLKQTVEGIPASMLSDRLKLLEREGIVVRRFYHDHPPRAEYVLTPKGHGLGVVVGALSSWGEKYAEHDRALVDDECGHGVTVVYHCPTCARQSPRSRVRMVDAQERHEG
jgi:DNA-binding HxlR family transcriptional regulator